MTKALIAGLGLAVAISSAGCEAEPPAEEVTGGLGRETFVATYLDLRLAAIRNGGTIDVRTKETILSNREVSEEDLLQFAETHGRDLGYMNEIWQEVQRRVDSVRIAPDQGGDHRPGI